MAEMKFRYKGNEYLLGFSRRTAQALEQSGFNIYEVDIKPLTRVPQLWSGAFALHHRKVSDDLKREIWNHMKRKDDAVARLGEMYMEAVSTLILDDEEEVNDDFFDWE